MPLTRTSPRPTQAMAARRFSPAAPSPRIAADRYVTIASTSNVARAVAASSSDRSASSSTPIVHSLVGATPTCPGARLVGSEP